MDASVADEYHAAPVIVFQFCQIFGGTAGAARRHVHEPALVGGARVGRVVVDVERSVGVSFGVPENAWYVEYLSWVSEVSARAAYCVDDRLAPVPSTVSSALPRPAGGVPGPFTKWPLPFAPSLRKLQPLGAGRHHDLAACGDERNERDANEQFPHCVPLPLHGPRNRIAPNAYTARRG